MKIIVFSSHTSTWYFAFAEAIIASELQKIGNDVLYITSGNQFVGVSDLMQERILRKEFSLRGYEIGTKLTDDFKEINLIMKSLNKNNFKNLIIDNINIGKIALYEFIIHHKKMDLNINQEEWKECLVYIKNTLISFFACRTIIEKEKPDRILMYNTLYSVNHVWERYANARGIPVYFLHHGVNFSDIDNTLIIAKNDSLSFTKELINIWHKVKKIPVSQKMLSYVTDHFLELLKATHYLVYSAPKSKKPINIRKIFNIKDSQKILTATMSSYDEVFAAQYVGIWNLPNNLIFASQAEWIKALIGYVKNRKNLFLIVRVHPREFPNKRESVKSEHARMLTKIFKNLPSNVKINWPTDNISIYDLAQETDVFLNAWSIVGVEMSLLGIPVVIYSKDLIMYPPDLNYVGKNLNDYFDKIELALKDGWSYERIKKTYRWLSLYYCRTIVRFRNKKVDLLETTVKNSSFSVFNYFNTTLSPKIRSFVLRFLVIIPGLYIGKKQREDCIRQLREHVDISALEKMLMKSEDTMVNLNEALASKVSTKEEDLSVQNEVRKIYQVFYDNVSKGTKIRKNSLQYNLKVFSK